MGRLCDQNQDEVYLECYTLCIVLMRQQTMTWFIVSSQLYLGKWYNVGYEYSLWVNARTGACLTSRVTLNRYESTLNALTTLDI